MFHYFYFTEKTKYAFLVRFKSSKSNLAANTILKFDNVKLNTNDCYNKTSGKLTAPKDGFYTFSWTTISLPGQDFTSVLVHDGDVVATNPVDSDSSNDYMTGSSTVVVEMKAREQVLLKVYSGEGDYLYAY